MNKELTVTRSEQLHLNRCCDVVKYVNKNNVKKGCENISVIKPDYLNQNGWTSDDIKRLVVEVSE